MTPNQPAPLPDRPSTPPPPSAMAESKPSAGRFPTFLKAGRSLFPALRKVGRSLSAFPGKLWRRTRCGLLWLGIFLVVAHISLNLWASLQLNRELATARQSGEPLTLAELAPPLVPDAQNAAKVYERANATLSKRVQHILEDDDPRHDTLNHQELASSRVAIALTRHAAAMPQCNFNRNLQDPLNDTYPQLTVLRRLARLIHQQALQEAHDGQTEAAFADMWVIFKISHHLAAEPNLIGWLTAVAVSHIGYKTLDEFLPQAKLTPAQGRAILQGLPGTDWSQTLSRAMLGERAMGLWMFETLHNDPAILPAKLSGGGEASQRPSLVTRCLIRLLALLWSPVGKLDEIEYLRLMHRATLYDNLPPFKAQTMESIEAEADAIPPYAIITRILAPVYNRVLINRDRVVALPQLAEVAVALDVYHTAHGHYPAVLQDVAPTWGHSLSLDPYSHQPFIYRRTGAKFELYSVGPNGKDEGGVGNNDDKDDIRLTPPPRHR